MSWAAYPPGGRLVVQVQLSELLSSLFFASGLSLYNFCILVLFPGEFHPSVSVHVVHGATSEVLSDRVSLTMI